jgi:hypothetical protein
MFCLLARHFADWHSEFSSLCALPHTSDGNLMYEVFFGTLIMVLSDDEIIGLYQIIL